VSYVDATADRRIDVDVVATLGPPFDIVEIGDAILERAMSRY
jgi:hypothetical protein